MATSKERRDAQKRQRHKEKREAARAARKERVSPETGGARRGAATAWAPADGYLSDDWHDWEARPAGVFVRASDGAGRAYVAFEVDLADEGLVTLRIREDGVEGSVQAIAGELGGERMMLQMEAPVLAKLLTDAIAHRRAAGLPDLPGTSKALALIDDVDPDESPFDFRFGREEDDEPTEEHPRSGIAGALRRLFGG